jgi:hypothetical protein
MYNLIKDLVAASSNVAKLGDIGDRVIGVQIGRVTDIQDPENLRRVKVELEAYPGQSTDWLECFCPIVNTDPPLPKLGQLTMVQFINGDPHRGIWQGVKVDLDLNPSFDQGDPRYDATHSIEGDSTILIGGNYIINCLETLQFTINNDSSITLAPNGEVTLANKHSSIAITKDGNVKISSQSATISLNSNGVAITGSSLKFNGVSVAMVGGRDTGNNTTIS